MKKLLILLGITLPLLFFKAKSFAYGIGDGYSFDNHLILKNGYEIVYSNNVLLICGTQNGGVNIWAVSSSPFTGYVNGSSSGSVVMNTFSVNGNIYYYDTQGITKSSITYPDSSIFNRSFSEAEIANILGVVEITFSYDTSDNELVYPTGYFRETGNKGSFSNILVLDNKPDNARVLVDYRWHSIDNINIQTSFWSRKFDISYDTTVNSTRYNFKEWSDNFTDTVIDLNDTFNDPFLVSFPVENRTFHYLNKNGQESTISAISANTVHQSMLAALNSPNSIYNSLDIFVAYAYKEGNVVKVSKWSQFYRDLQGNLNGVSNSDLGFIESGQASQNSYHYVYDMTNADKNSTSIINDYGNPNAQTVVNNIFDTSQFDTTQTIQNLNNSYQGIFQMVQNVPQMFSQLFSFMPSWVITLLAVSIGLLVIVGLIKALL